MEVGQYGARSVPGATELNVQLKKRGMANYTFLGYNLRSKSNYHALERNNNYGTKN
jgi:hypothetical protein